MFEGVSHSPMLRLMATVWRAEKTKAFLGWDLSKIHLAMSRVQPK